MEEIALLLPLTSARFLTSWILKHAAVELLQLVGLGDGFTV